MERLTEYMGNGNDYESINPIDTPYEYGKANLQALINKLAAYEDAEEQGLLLRLPCKIGSDVYIVPSETNFRMNIFAGHPEDNRVYHQKVALITFTEKDGTWSVIRIENMLQAESCQKKCTRKPGFYHKRKPKPS